MLAGEFGELGVFCIECTEKEKGWKKKKESLLSSSKAEQACPYRLVYVLSQIGMVSSLKSGNVDKVIQRFFTVHTHLF